MAPPLVDFEYARFPAVRIASISWSGPWNEKKIRSQFEKVAAWAKRTGTKTGRWIFREPGERRWEAGLELKGKARASGGIRLKTLRAAPIARVTFDPEAVSPRVVYHGLNDWLKWQKKEKKIRGVVSSREVYSGNPWRDPKVWARIEVQFVVRK
ncbi:MAG TPA: GyrI-like domain-containing protein [Thermoplasmata archaeon]|nr:GyrI-like domain-containing protein [Thermoplasmata archaeon]